MKQILSILLVFLLLLSYFCFPSVSMLYRHMPST